MSEWKKVGTKCDFCYFLSVGKFQVTYQDWEQGESRMIKELCQKHYDQAMREGRVFKVNEETRV